MDINKIEVCRSYSRKIKGKVQYEMIDVFCSLKQEVEETKLETTANKLQELAEQFVEKAVKQYGWSWDMTDLASNPSITMPFVERTMIKWTPEIKRGSDRFSNRFNGNKGRGNDNKYYGRNYSRSNYHSNQGNRNRDEEKPYHNRDNRNRDSRSNDNRNSRSKYSYTRKRRY